VTSFTLGFRLFFNLLQINHLGNVRPWKAACEGYRDIEIELNPANRVKLVIYCIYIYIERERERERQFDMNVCECQCSVY
jgi:hypothetical protein